MRDFIAAGYGIFRKMCIFADMMLTRESGDPSDEIYRKEGYGKKG